MKEKSFAGRLIAMLLLLCISFASISLLSGALTLTLPKKQSSSPSFTPPPFLPSFPEITASSSSAQTNASPTTTPTTDAPVPTPTPTPSSDEKDIFVNISSISNPNAIFALTTDRSSVSLAERGEQRNAFLAGIGASSSVEDAVIADWQSYDKDLHRLLLADELSVDLDNVYTLGTEESVAYYRVPNSDDGSYATHSYTLITEKKLLRTYMGYLLLTVGKATQLLDCYGNIICEDMGDYLPANKRDFSNNPLFYKKTDDGVYYGYDTAKQKFIKADGNYVRVYLEYDYPAYPIAQGLKNCEVSHRTSSGYYRFVNPKTGKNYFSTSYTLAFNYTADGYAIVCDRTNNRMRVLDTDKVSINLKNLRSRYSHPFAETIEGARITCRDNFVMPDTFGIESIGVSGFDHGYILARIHATSVLSNIFGKIIEDRYCIMDATGAFLDIPDGYEIKGYSDGVVLLERDGLYGYYSVSGRWIAQPIFTYAQPFIQGLAVLGFEDGSVGMIDTEGNVVIGFCYTYIDNVSSGVITAYNEANGWDVFYLTQKSEG